jgi:hypothetical protein
MGADAGDLQAFAVRRLWFVVIAANNAQPDGLIVVALFT